MNRIAIVTGATSGFGRAIAENFAQQNIDLIITGRRNERLLEVQQQLQQQYGITVHTACFDVRDKATVIAQLGPVVEKFEKIDILVNNAGLALGMEDFLNADTDDWDTMLDTNVKGLWYVTKLVIPIMSRTQHGHIVNIGSTAAKSVYKNGNAYCASKHAVDALSHAMRIDLLPYGIKVTAVHPGAAETEFSQVRFKGDEALAGKVYNGFTPLYAPDIANVVSYCINLPANVCINDLTVTCLAQADAQHINKKQ
jgi:NADP-dependent 3-hydroxy acid dehydrogenase YdfG